MALVKCEECGRDVSDKAPACPGCGCPLATRSLAAAPDVVAASTIPEQPEKVPPQQVEATPHPVAIAATTALSPSVAAIAPTAPIEPARTPPKPSHRSRIYVGAIGGLMAIAAVAALVHAKNSDHQVGNDGTTSAQPAESVAAQTEPGAGNRQQAEPPAAVVANADAAPPEMPHKPAVSEICLNSPEQLVGDWSGSETIVHYEGENNETTQTRTQHTEISITVDSAGLAHRSDDRDPETLTRSDACSLQAVNIPTTTTYRFEAGALTINDSTDRRHGGNVHMVLHRASRAEGADHRQQVAQKQQREESKPLEIAARSCDWDRHTFGKDDFWVTCAVTNPRSIAVTGFATASLYQPRKTGRLETAQFMIAPGGTQAVRVHFGGVDYNEHSTCACNMAVAK